MQLVIGPKAQIRCLYEEMIDLSSLGTITIQRASQVEPDDEGRWWANLQPVLGPLLGPFSLRSEALQAERQWLENHLALSLS